MYMVQCPLLVGWGVMMQRPAAWSQGWKKPGFKKKNQPSRFSWVFWFFWVFGFFYIFAQKREILGFIQFQEFKNKVHPDVKL
jgi:hypothetical protein